VRGPAPVQEAGPLAADDELQPARFTLRDGHLTLAGGISLRVIWSRELPSAPSSVRVYQDALGHWYASFVVTAEIEQYPETGDVIGIDWGVRDIAITTSDAHDLPHPEFGKKSAEKLTRYQRQMARRKPERGKPASAGYKRAERKAAKVHAQVAAQRQTRPVSGPSQLSATSVSSRSRTSTEVPGKEHDGKESSRRRDRGGQASLLEAAAKHGRVVHLVRPGLHHDGLQRVRGESQVRCRCPREPTHAVHAVLSCRGTRTAPRDAQQAGLNPAGADRVRPRAA